MLPELQIFLITNKFLLPLIFRLTYLASEVESEVTSPSWTSTPGNWEQYTQRILCSLLPPTASPHYSESSQVHTFFHLVEVIGFWRNNPFSQGVVAP